jgi:hypothetical protein
LIASISSIKNLSFASAGKINEKEKITVDPRLSIPHLFITLSLNQSSKISVPLTGVCAMTNNHLWQTKKQPGSPPQNIFFRLCAELVYLH